MHDLFSRSITQSQKSEVRKWWTSFQENQEDLHLYFSECLQNEFDLVSWMRNTLQSIDARIMWEFGPGLKKKHRLVITSGSRKELRSLIKYILREAPELEHFEFYEYRLPQSIKQTSLMTEAIYQWPDLSSIDFKTAVDDFNRIQITCYSRFKDNKKTQLDKLRFITERLLGEETFEKWVGFIEVKEQPPFRNIGFLKVRNKDAISLNHLAAEVQKRIEEIKSTLPRKPYYEDFEEDPWVVLNLKPEKKKDYAFKEDLFVARFVSEALFRAMHEERTTFSAERFSNHGEIFLYLKMDGSSEDLDQELFEDKASIEDALELALNGQGRMIGTGTGLRYSYIDLAVKKLDEAIPVIQNTLQKGKLTKRSWLILHDPDYQNEWIGIWADSPAPYLVN